MLSHITYLLKVILTILSKSYEEAKCYIRELSFRMWIGIMVSVLGRTKQRQEWAILA
jgi:hypothetical protein